MHIVIAADHAAWELKDSLTQWLRDQGHTLDDLGTNGPESVDYPDYGFAVAEHLAEGKAELGVLLCGSGIGISIAANRHPGCRCAQVSEPLSAALARTHNDANCIAMGARLIGPEMAIACLKAFLSNEFADAGNAEGRHTRRVNKLSHPHFTKDPA